ncbi:sugar phosphate isomerase/epimerase family protein [Huintestinicola sp.]|uniref:sugar phosphate isomerase/epimerase family protein n=1 Tax=Huintestinicola sp. TaxID=2981661 RepID=UPI003D7D8914
MYAPKFPQLNIFLEHIFEGAEQQGISPEKMLAYAREAGYKGLECDLWRLSDKSETKKLFDSCGLSVSSVYNMYDMGHKEFGVSKEMILNHLETAAYFGAKTVLAVPGFIHPEDNFDAVRDRMAEALNFMCKSAEKYGITVTLEDFDDNAAPYSTSDGLLWFMENVKGLGFTFDTGNFAYSLENAEDAYIKLRKYISHVHLKDRSHDRSRANSDNTNGKPDLSGRIMYPCEVGSGYIGIEGLVKKLLSNGYKGSLSIEHFGANDQLLYMKKSAENVIRIIKEMS